MKNLRRTILLITFCCLVGIFCGCANSEKKFISKEKVQTSFPEWVDATGLADNSVLLLQKYEESKNTIDITIRIPDDRVEGYRDVLELIDRHNSFVKDNPGYFNDYVEINIDVARGGAPVAEMAFLANFGTFKDATTLGEKNNASFSYVNFYREVDPKILESGISFNLANVIVRQASGNNCNSEESYKCLSLCPSCKNVIVYIDGDDELTDGISYIGKYAEKAKVYISRYGNEIIEAK